MRSSWTLLTINYKECMIFMITTMSQIQVGYKRPRTFVLTPSRKHICKAVARQSKKTIAVESLKDPVVKKHILKKIGKEMAKEIRSVASDKAESVLRSQDADSLKTFHWDTLLQELSTFAPVLRMLLTAATKTRTPRSNTNGVIGMCAAILLNHQDPRMNLVQKINSLILYGGHCSKQVWSSQTCMCYCDAFMYKCMLCEIFTLIS